MYVLYTIGGPNNLPKRRHIIPKRRHIMWRSDSGHYARQTCRFDCVGIVKALRDAFVE
jgi:hypothetical protein